MTSKPLLHAYKYIYKIIDGCDAFEPLMHIIDWIDCSINFDKFPLDDREEVLAFKRILFEKVNEQKSKLAGDLSDEMIDINQGKHF